jgi:uncharacterized protein Smg (DUF494 family)
VKGRIIDIIVFLMQQIDESGRGLSHFENLIGDLQEKGYSQAEINAAFYWLLERLRLRLGQLAKNHKGLMNKSSRILHSSESIHFSSTGYGYLIQLYQLGLIDDEQREQIIHRAVMLGLDEIGEPEIKMLAARLLLNSDWDQIESGHLLLLDESIDGTIH